ncbi:acyltransferase [Chitinibacter sp. SCUT-21]|uniref:LpxL/LpxP family acyltransferase n=1 Tax=Chitinibacter sp. SCUT-21 TaxID=2970891 RepID=UPI0035A703E9
MTQTNWSEQRERGGKLAYWGMKIMLKAYALGGRPLFALILYPVLAWFFCFGKLARLSSQDYLQRLSRSAPHLQLRVSLRLSWQHYLSFADTILAKFHAWTGQLQHTQVSCTGRKMMLQRLAQGQGGIMLTAHLGNTEAMQALSQANENLRLNVLVHTQHAEQFNRILAAQAHTRAVRLIQVSDINPALAADLTARVERGEWLVIAADRVPVNANKTAARTLIVDFLGAKARLPLGPHLLALMMQCPLVFAVCLKQGDGLHLYFETLSEPQAVARTAREAWLAASAQRYADKLAYYCQLAPLQWFNFYPFWTDDEPDQ